MNKFKNEYKLTGKLYVSKILYTFVNKELLKETKIKPKLFWSGLEKSLYFLREKMKNYYKQEKIYKTL